MSPDLINRLLGISVILLAIAVVFPYERFKVPNKAIVTIKVIYVIAMLAISIRFLLLTF
jgi:hypothetical protein